MSRIATFFSEQELLIDEKEGSDRYTGHPWVTVSNLLQGLYAMGHPHIHAVPEMALAHSHVDKTEEAYAWGDLFAKRRILMEAWARCCNKKAKMASVSCSLRRSDAG